MKRAVCTFICILFAFCLTACGKNNMKVKTPKVSSERYSQKEVRQLLMSLRTNLKGSGRAVLCKKYITQVMKYPRTIRTGQIGIMQMK